MFVVKLDGDVVALTNTLGSAAVYVDGIRRYGHTVTITVVQVGNLAPVLRLLEASKHAWGDVETSNVHQKPRRLHGAAAR